MLIQANNVAQGKTVTNPSKVVEVAKTEQPAPLPEDTVELSGSQVTDEEVFTNKFVGAMLSGFPVIGGLVNFFGAAANLGHGNYKGAAAGAASSALNLASLMAIDQPHLILPAMACMAGSMALGAYSWHQLAESAKAEERRNQMAGAAAT